MKDFTLAYKGAHFSIIATTARTVTLEIFVTSGNYPTKGEQFKVSRKSIENMIKSHTEHFNSKDYRVQGVRVLSKGVEVDAFGTEYAAEKYVNEERTFMWAGSDLSLKQVNK